jgi:hypothetical protein
VSKFTNVDSEVITYRKDQNMEHITYRKGQNVKHETSAEMLKSMRRYYRDEFGMPDRDLPCDHCLVDHDETTESGYVWITCEADDEDGCNWGNL